MRVRSGHQHQSPHELGILHGELKPCAAAKRVAHHVDLLETEFLYHHAEVATDIDRIDLSFAERGSAVSVKMDGDDLAVDLGRVEVHRLEERISVIEATAGNLREMDDELTRQVAQLDGRQKGYQDRLSGLLADLAVHRAQTADQFQRLHQLNERLRRRQIEDLERDLREMRIHAFRAAEEQT